MNKEYKVLKSGVKPNWPLGIAFFLIAGVRPGNKKIWI